MDNKLFGMIWEDAQNQQDMDAFVSDWATSSLFLDPEHPDQEIDSSIVDQLGRLWQVANLPFREFLKLLGLSQTTCSVRFCIHLRTVQHWALGERACPSYIRLMMAELCGAVTLRSLS